MKCEKCGADIPNGSKFCNSCGAPIDLQFDENLDHSNYQVDKKSPKKKIIIGVVIVVCVVLATTIIVFCKQMMPSSSVKSLIEKIDTIDTVELSDENTINELELEYNNLSKREKKQVKNYDVLENALAELKELKSIEETVSQLPYSVAIELAKTIKNSLNNPSSFQLYNVKYQEGTEGMWNKYCFYYDYSGENKMGGTTRKQIIIEYVNKEVSVYEDRNLYPYMFEMFEEDKYDDIENLNAEIINLYL